MSLAERMDGYLGLRAFGMAEGHFRELLARPSVDDCPTCPSSRSQEQGVAQ